MSRKSRAKIRKQRRSKAKKLKRKMAHPNIQAIMFYGVKLNSEYDIPLVSIYFEDSIEKFKKEFSEMCIHDLDIKVIEDSTGFEYPTIYIGKILCHITNWDGKYSQLFRCIRGKTNQSYRWKKSIQLKHRIRGDIFRVRNAFSNAKIHEQNCSYHLIVCKNQCVV